jgi:hypothetical protein
LSLPVVVVVVLVELVPVLGVVPVPAVVPVLVVVPVLAVEPVLVDVLLVVPVVAVVALVADDVLLSACALLEVVPADVDPESSPQPASAIDTLISNAGQAIRPDPNAQWAFVMRTPECDSVAGRRTRSPSGELPERVQQS